MVYHPDQISMCENHIDLYISGMASYPQLHLMHARFYANYESHSHMNYFNHMIRIYHMIYIHPNEIVNMWSGNKSKSVKML